MRSVFEGWKARDFDRLLELTDPQISAELVLPPGVATESYSGRDEIRAFLHDGDAEYEYFEAEPKAFAIGPTGRVFAEGLVSYRKRGARGMSSIAFWVCEVKEGRIVSWQSFSDRGPALAASGL